LHIQTPFRFKMHPIGNMEKSINACPGQADFNLEIRRRYLLEIQGPFPFR
jgi:hypothetical protein